MMRNMVDQILKIPCKFKSEEDQGSNARIGAIHLGRVCKFIEQGPNIQDGLERRRTSLIHVIQAIDGGGIA
jgi:hypothetical protein